jgi:hypothetical protein
MSLNGNAINAELEIYFFNFFIIALCAKNNALPHFREGCHSLIVQVNVLAEKNEKLYGAESPFGGILSVFQI